MIRYAAISTSGKRYRSDDRSDIDRWCSELVKAGEECEVYAQDCRSGGGKIPYRCGIWRPIEAAGD